MKNTILVTGGSGLVGRNLEDVVSGERIKDDRFIFVSSKDADLTNLAEVDQLFNLHKPTIVIHLAAYVGGLFKNMKNNFNFLTINMKINENIYTSAHKYKVRKCISCMSTCIFPDKTTYPIDESMLHDGPPNSTNFGYSYAKRFLDILNQAYNSHQTDTLFTSFIPCNVYGKFDNFNLNDGHVLPCLIHKAYLAKNKNEPLLILGTGTPLRQFIYAKDLARLILKLIFSYNDPSPIILSPDESDEVPISFAAECIRKSFEIPQELKFDPSFADGQFKKTASNSKLRSLWPDFEFTPLSEGIRETVEWFKFNYHTCRK